MKNLNHAAFFLTLNLLFACWQGERISDLADHDGHSIGSIHKMDGPERFLAYHRAIRTAEGDGGPQYLPGYKQRALHQAYAKRSKARSAPLPWISRGPANVGGRTRGLWHDRSDTTAMTLYAGAASGGVWKTEDGGQTWRNLTADFPNLATATLAGSLHNPKVLYAGTGEGFGASRRVLGNGIWKSIDGGESWTPLASTILPDQLSVIYRIIVDPNDEDHLVFSALTNPRQPNQATTSNIYRSVDGGLSIESIYSSADAIQQVVSDPTDFEVLYATIYGSGIIKSSDGGDHWRLVYEADRDFCRLEMAVSPTAPSYLYLSAQRNPSSEDQDQSTSKLLMSDDGGETWFDVEPVNAANAFGNWMGDQGWYNNTLAVHPYDSSTVFVGGAGPILKITIEEFDDRADQYLAIMEPVVDTYREYINRYPEARGKGVHVDHHHLLLIPRDSVEKQFFIISGNDGGVAFSQDGGESFLQTGATFDSECEDIFCNNILHYETADGFITAQFYGVDKQNGADRYVGGTQDNGSWISPSDPDAESDWDATPGGDGFEPVWHFEKTNQVIETSQFNNAFRSDNGGRSWRRLELPGEGPFLTRMAGSQQDPDLLFSVSDQGVLKSTDFGDSWQVITMPEGWRFQGLATPVRISIANPSIVWSGAALRENSEMTVSSDGGTTFQMATRYQGASLGLITNIATHPLADSTAYFLFSQADGPKVIRTTDLGETLEDISGFVTNRPESSNGFPDVATYDLLVMPHNPDILWAGTEIGLFESTNSGDSWHLADNGLPNVSIWQLKVVNDEVVVATHGRGIWTVALPELEAYQPKPVAALAPRLDLDDDIFASRVSGTVRLRSNADSVRLILQMHVEGDTTVEIRKLDMKDAGVFSFTEFATQIEGDQFHDVIAKVEAFHDGVVLRDLAAGKIHAVDYIPIAQYFSDFSDDQKDFALLDWMIENPEILPGRSLNSPHPYPNLSLSMAVFQKPILIDAVTTPVSFDEVVLVEPGETDDFPSQDFFDFCLIEATADFGRSFSTIAAYDSRAEEDWLAAYDRDPFTPSESLFKTRAFDLAQFFQPGDSVYLRFKLFSDPRLEGWGWTIDNFSVGEDPTPVIDHETGILEYQVLSNPARDQLRISWSTHSNLRLHVSLTSLQRQTFWRGNKVEIYDGFISNWDVSHLPPGMYFLRLQGDGVDATIKWLKI